MAKSLIDVLAELVEAAPGADAFHVRIADQFESRDVSPDEIDAIFEDFKSDYEETVASIRQDWGDPTYSGAVDRDDFPLWSEALLLTSWQRGPVTAYVALRHDDDHEPMFVEVGALTDDEISTLVYTKS